MPPTSVAQIVSEGGAQHAPPDRGATYEWLESQATRVTIRFPGIVAITERAADGEVRTRLTDVVGNDLAFLNVRRIDATNDEIAFRSVDATEIRTTERLRSRPTLDWAGRQAYSFWKDRGAGASRLVWQAGMLRPRGGRLRDIDREIDELRSEWTGGLAATTVKTAAPPGVKAGASALGNAWLSRLRKDNADVGYTRWNVEQRVLDWSYPGLTEGYLDAARLAPVGGWTFTPDMAWTNVQSFAFHHFHSLVAAHGFVARRQQGWKEKVLGLVMPVVAANEPGCDGLHWLDRTVFRPCCDSHDRCYAKYGCSSRSWWRWWSSWSCSSCNAGAVFCFASGGKSPYYPSPY
jgi:hypothetical protein